METPPEASQASPMTWSTMAAGVRRPAQRLGGGRRQPAGSSSSAGDDGGKAGNASRPSHSVSGGASGSSPRARASATLGNRCEVEEPAGRANPATGWRRHSTSCRRGRRPAATPATR